MELLVGAAALLAGVLLYAWAYGKHHGVNAPGWAKTQLFASSISLIVTGFAPVGIGYIVAGLINAAGQSVVSWAALSALPVLSWLIAPRLARTGKPVHTADIVPLPTGPSVPPQPGPMRRAA